MSSDRPATPQTGDGAPRGAAPSRHSLPGGRVWSVALDVLRDGARRRWLLLAGAVVTLALGFLALSMRLPADGSSAVGQLFAAPVAPGVRGADVAVRALFAFAAYGLFYAGLPFGIALCADVAPALLAPGRVELLASLPLRRAELLAGILLGVLLLATGTSLYAAGGLAIVLGLKTAVWSAGPLGAALLLGATFGAIYAAMLAAAVVARSTALSGGAGGVVLVLGLLAARRDTLSGFFAPGFGRAVFLGLTAVVPRIGPLADAAAQLAGGGPIDPSQVASLLAGAAAFAAAMFALAAAVFARRDL